MLQLRVVVRRYPARFDGALIAHIGRTLDLEHGCAVEAEAVERGPHPFELVVYQAKRLHLNADFTLVRLAREPLELAPAPCRRSRCLFLHAPGLYRPQHPRGLESSVAHDDRSVAGAEALPAPAVPLGRVLLQLLNSGHGLCSPGFVLRACG